MQNITHTRTPDVQSTDAAHSLLSSRRRREAVAGLANREVPADVRELGAAVASRETGTSPDATADAVTISLHHVHLPKLDDAGIIDYDPETNAVTSLAPGALAQLLNPPDGS